MKPPPSSQAAEAPTVVYWDIDRCPVPCGFDAGQVGPCIVRFLRNLGYSGPLIITAVGILTDVPEDVLRKVSSTGIFLHHGAYSYRDMNMVLYGVTNHVELPANVMVISTPPSYTDTLSLLDEWGFNVIYPFSYDFPQEPSSINSLWSNFLRAGVCLSSDSGPPLECSNTGQWVCIVCNDLDGLGAESLIRHLSSREHACELWEWLPPCGCSKLPLDSTIETPRYSRSSLRATMDMDDSDMDDSDMVHKQPKRIWSMVLKKLRT
ncbi:unnamed protein product [Arabidopsis lyrata]|uniref:uncharacterized protein LOC9325614 n=1 Tax=Arabidopsis lyrata subsp. lyrata TaxID=81972 RepID=UPI000A29A9F0|nr:uncharacterized protein LOC9325614 [Arabidopsis lyrata subsp. lyrata]XP_020869215.1 uncharacterized protein LOC9325614 [Arabidopsis lyrata subsp. lyrata]CAH8251255.1 unnamed protein product [Arabidopsis lyrata]|eukprot:XP_002889550.2 uncharacterized protein LOC9325614 [Arabidopsis lyrata subsp. lyrata]